MSAGQTQVLRDLGAGWLQCQDQQGIFYFNQQTQQSSDTLPAELGGQQMSPQQVYGQMQAQQLQAQQQAQQQREAQEREARQRLQAQQLQAQQLQAQQMQAQQAPQQEAKQKFTLGPWVVCEDAQGEFYYHTPTGQSYDQPPQELVQLYKASQGQQQPAQQTYTTAAAAPQYVQQAQQYVQQAQPQQYVQQQPQQYVTTNAYAGQPVQYNQYSQYR